MRVAPTRFRVGATVVSGCRSEPQARTATVARGRPVRSSRSSTEPPRPAGPQRRRKGLTLAVGVLHDEDATGAQQTGRPSGDEPRDREAVLAAAVERDVRVVVAHLGVDGDGDGGDVGRVRHDDVDLEEVVEGGHGILLHDLDVEVETVPVARRPRHRKVADLDGDDLRLRQARP